MIAPRPRREAGFTLVELLVVIAIVAIVSAATLPTIIPAISHRQVSDAARTLQAALINARDSASRANAPRGLRFLRDQALGGTMYAYGSFVEIGLAPDYSEGTVSLLPNTATNTGGTFFPPYGSNNTSLFIVYGPTLDSTGAIPQSPTSWYWNIRKGDRIRIHDAGPYYTIVGPTAIPLGPNNPEGFINEGTPGTTPSGPAFTTATGPAYGAAGTSSEFLVLANGRDDNHNGLVDEGFDGVDNDNNGFADDFSITSALPTSYGTNGAPTNYPYVNDSSSFEFEMESPVVPVPPYSAYTIVRRPMVTERARVTSLPTNVVIDATTVTTTMERSRLPIDAFNPQYFDVLFSPTGQVLPSLPYSGTAAISPIPFYHFWLTEREGVQDTAKIAYPALPVPPPVGTLQGERRLVTLNTRSGNLLVKMIEDFSSLNAPYLDAQNGVKDKQ